VQYTAVIYDYTLNLNNKKGGIMNNTKISHFTSMTEQECKMVNGGGGWISRVISQFITDLKCGCEGVIDGDVARSGVGSMVR